MISRFQGSAGLASLGGAAGILDTSFYVYVVDHLGSLILIQLVIGVMIGVVVSVLSIRRFLKA